MTWSELGLENKVWMIPPNREGRKLKTRYHKVPLTAPMLGILQEAKQIHRSEFVFAGSGGHPMSENTMSKLMREILDAEVEQGRRLFLINKPARKPCRTGYDPRFETGSQSVQTILANSRKSQSRINPDRKPSWRIEERPKSKNGDK